MDFGKVLLEETKWTETENGQPAKNTTGSALLDLFGVIGGLRSRSERELYQLLEAAYSENPLLTVKTVFYARDIKGLGERQTFRNSISYLADRHPEALLANLHLIGEYGRYDDLYSLVGTKLEQEMWRVMKSRFEQDLINMDGNESVSLLAKWIKSADSKQVRTRTLGILTAKKLGYSVYDFKRLVKKLRKYIRVTEGLMSTNQWDSINYSAVPSRAMMVYRDAFKRHDKDRFNEFVLAATKGDAKINSSALYPYDLINEYMSYMEFSPSNVVDPVIEAQWQQLPNYVEEGTNAIVMADVSGSMDGLPLATSIGLALYFAERNKGAYHNLFMTFSSSPDIVAVEGDTLCDKIDNVWSSKWGMSTNLNKAFDRILEVALENDVPPEDMVKSIIVVSDMEIDNCESSTKKKTFYDKKKQDFEEHGYTLPNVVFWNCASRHNVFHADADRKGVQLVSGHSPTVFKQLVNSIGKTPYELMLQVLNDERYEPLTIVDTNT